MLTGRFVHKRSRSVNSRLINSRTYQLRHLAIFHDMKQSLVLVFLGQVRVSSQSDMLLTPSSVESRCISFVIKSGKCQTPLHGYRLRTCCTTPPTDELRTILKLFVQQICHIYRLIAAVQSSSRQHVLLKNYCSHCYKKRQIPT